MSVTRFLTWGDFKRLWGVKWGGFSSKSPHEEQRFHGSLQAPWGEKRYFFNTIK